MKGADAEWPHRVPALLTHPAGHDSAFSQPQPQAFRVEVALTQRAWKDIKTFEIFLSLDMLTVQNC